MDLYDYRVDWRWTCNEKHEYMCLYVTESVDIVCPQLRSSFKQAFGKKKSSKLQAAHDELDEVTDSLPASPKLQHISKIGNIQALHTSPSTTE